MYMYNLFLAETVWPVMAYNGMNQSMTLARICYNLQTQVKLVPVDLATVEHCRQVEQPSLTNPGGVPDQAIYA